MSAYLRKAFTLGPFRFNLSKSGIGVSFGVTGLRIGTGPNGPYFHAGRGGIYFKKSLKNLQENEECINEENENTPEEPISNKKKIWIYTLNVIVGIAIFVILFAVLVCYFFIELLKSASNTKMKSKINRRSRKRR